MAKAAAKKEVRRFEPEEIQAILKEQDDGEKVSDICKRHGISTSAFYNWKNGKTKSSESEKPARKSQGQKLVQASQNGSARRIPLPVQGPMAAIMANFEQLEPSKQVTVANFLSEIVAENEATR